MRRLLRPLLALPLVLAAAACGATLPDDVEGVLAGAESMEILALHPYPHDEAGAPRSARTWSTS